MSGENHRPAARYRQLYHRMSINVCKILAPRFETRIWAHKTSLTVPPFIEEVLPRQEGWTVIYICLLGVSILPDSTIYLLDFWTVLTGNGILFKFIEQCILFPNYYQNILAVFWIVTDSIMVYKTVILGVP